MEIQSLGRVIGALVITMLIITLATVTFLVIDHHTPAGHAAAPAAITYSAHRR